jgi:hypothetical protein
MKTNRRQEDADSQDCGMENAAHGSVIDRETRQTDELARRPGHSNRPVLGHDEIALAPATVIAPRMAIARRLRGVRGVAVIPIAGVLPADQGQRAVLVAAGMDVMPATPHHGVSEEHYGGQMRDETVQSGPSVPLKSAPSS